MKRRLGQAAAFLAAALLAASLAGCSMPAGQFVDPPSETTAIFVASLRGAPVPGSDLVTRSSTLSYAVHTVSVPPRRALGKVSPNGPSRYPRTDFFDLGASGFADGDAFMTDLSKTALALGAPGEVMVFVHGFNNSFEHGLRRIAEIDTDYRAPIVKLLFDWPTDDDLFDYGHDLDSARFSRDGLENLIESLGTHGFKRIVLVGYSMGADIVMEVLRQMRIAGKDKAIAKIGGVVMIAPDIDVEVFGADVNRIAPLPTPFVVYSSPNDWPLRDLQKFIYADKPRLGTITDFAPIADLPLTVITAPTSGEPAEALHLATSSLSVITAANQAGTDLAEFAAVAAKVPGANVETFGRATKVALP